VRIPFGPNGEKPLVGWPEIARFLDVSEDSAQRWATVDGFPDWASYQLPTRKIGRTPYAYPSHLDVWLSQADMPLTLAGRLRRRAVGCGSERGRRAKTAS
jgi:hypothetical protein